MILVVKFIASYKNKKEFKNKSKEDPMSNKN